MTTLQPGTTLTPADIASLCDHALLRPELTPAEVLAGAREMAGLSSPTGPAPAWSVCVRPSDVAAVAQELAGTRTRVCTVLGFPHGTTSTAAKVAETEQAVADGAVELDMVVTIGRLLGGDLAYAEADVAAVVEVGHEHGAVVKVILETVLLDEAAKVAGCRLSESAGADFVKTSTGFAGGGATLPDVRLMRATVSDAVQVKASGGVRDIRTALAMVAAGATRLGTSSTAALVEQAAELAERGELVVPADDAATPEASAPTGY